MLTIDLLHDRLIELLHARHRLMRQIRTNDGGIDFRALRLHAYACRDVSDARLELEKALMKEKENEE